MCTQQEIELWRVINDMLIIETPYDHANNNMSEKTLVISIEQNWDCNMFH